MWLKSLETPNLSSIKDMSKTLRTFVNMKYVRRDGECCIDSPLVFVG